MKPYSWEGSAFVAAQKDLDVTWCLQSHVVKRYGVFLRPTLCYKYRKVAHKDGVKVQTCPK